MKLKILIIFVGLLCGFIWGAGKKAPLGIDVSHFSGDVDWPEVKKSGYGFAILKATEGVDLLDPSFKAHWKALKKEGILRGAYHFYVTEDDPKDQADFYIKNVTLSKGDIIPIVDIEVIGHGTKPGLTKRVKTFLNIIEKHYKAKPIIYTGPNFWQKHIRGNFSQYPIWIAEYGVEKPRLPKDWKSWHLWQYKENTRVPGIEKDTDLSRIHPKLKLRTIIMQD